MSGGAGPEGPPRLAAPEAPGPASGQASSGPRRRRRRALASALRLVAAQEAQAQAQAQAGAGLAGLRERLAAIAASQGVFLPPPDGSEGDAAEALARLQHAGPPPECAALLAALLLPLLALRSEPRGPDR